MASSRARLNLARAAVAAQAPRFTHLPALLLVSDDQRLPDPCASARQLPKGAGVLLRHRDARWRAALGQALASIARDRALRFIIAEDIPLALRLRAHVHLSEAHRHCAWRAHLAGIRLVTIAAHSETACWKAKLAGADAVLMGAVFATASHPERAGIGAMRLRLMAQRLSVPIYAMGGLDAGNARRLSGAGLAGLAAVGALKA